MPIKCKICSSPMNPAFTTIVLGKYEGTFYYCHKCGFLCTHEPYWLEESYSFAIASTDTGLLSRNVAVAGRMAVLLYVFLCERGNGRYLDIAGGYGLLTRLMRDFGFDFYWSDKYCQNLVARGFEYSSDLGGCRAITAIEVLEHVEDPFKFIKDAMEIGQTDTLIFTTELFEGNPPAPDQWWYYSFETGQHISFFKRSTLEILAINLGLHFATNGWLHIFSRKKINRFLFCICTGKLAALMYPLVRRHLGSLLMDDHNFLVRQNFRN